MNIVIPAAGRGIRFQESGFDIPKPLIDVGGKPMLYRAVESLGIYGDYIIITYDYKKDIYKNDFNADIDNIIVKLLDIPFVKSVNNIRVSNTTEGPASSVYLAYKFINNKDQLVTANCDQVMNWDGYKFIDYCNNKNLDGCVVTYKSNTPKNSYVSIDDSGFAVKLAEKLVISENSLNGIHFWRNGCDFVDSYIYNVSNNIRTNGEFYISETYNRMIERGKKIGIYNIDKDAHNAVGTPDDLFSFLKRI